jgi:hypothetical protein
MNTIERHQEARRILKQCPFSSKHFMHWMKSITGDRCERTIAHNTFEVTLPFIRSHKLAKAKTLRWLASNNIASDFEVVAKLFAPTARLVIENCGTERQEHSTLNQPCLNSHMQHSEVVTQP